MCGSNFVLRPNSVPERIKYYSLYFLFLICLSYYSALIFNVLYSYKSQNFYARDKIVTGGTAPLYPQFGTLAARMQSFSTWPASSNQNADDLSESGFFYTSNVFYKQKPVYYRNKYFLKEPANIKIVFVTGIKDYTVCFHCGVALKDLKITYSVWREHAIWSPKCLHTTYKKGPAFVLCAPRTE